MIYLLFKFKNVVRNYISFWYKKIDSKQMIREKPFRDLP